MLLENMRLTRNYAYWLVVAGSIAWLGLAVGAAYARARGWEVASLLDAAYGRVCHQIPERSAWLFGEPLAVCHRCLGLYSGFVVGLLTLPYLPRLRHRLLDRPRSIVLFFVPMLADVFLWSNVPLSRMASGFVAAFPVGLLVWAAVCQVEQQARARNAPRPPLIPISGGES